MPHPARRRRLRARGGAVWRFDEAVCALVARLRALVPITTRDTFTSNAEMGSAPASRSFPTMPRVDMENPGKKTVVLRRKAQWQREGWCDRRARTHKGQGRPVSALVLGWRRASAGVGCQAKPANHLFCAAKRRSSHLPALCPQRANSPSDKPWQMRRDRPSYATTPVTPPHTLLSRKRSRAVATSCRQRAGLATGIHHRCRWPGQSRNRCWRARPT